MEWPLDFTSDLLNGQFLPGCSKKLEPYEVQARDPLGDRVLDLESGVYLQEVEVAVGVQQELDGACVGVVNGGGKGEG